MAEKEAILAHQEEERTDQRRKTKLDKKVQKKMQKGVRAGDKRKAEQGDYNEWNESSGKMTRLCFYSSKDFLSEYFFPSATEQASKRHRGNEDQTSEEQMETEMGLSGRNAPPGIKKAQRVGVAAAQRHKDDKPELRNDKDSVFISNLVYTLEDPEAKLRTLFETCGPIQQIRPVFSNKGTFKGYCYIQFESTASVSEALKLDRQEIESRPMFVSPCVDKNKNPDFKVNIISYG